jgi:hypothetical protein
MKCIRKYNLTGFELRKRNLYSWRDPVMLEDRDYGQWGYGRSFNISGVGLFFESEIRTVMIIH